MTMETHKKLLLLILLGALVIRLLGSNLVIYNDEAHYTNIEAYFNSGFFGDASRYEEKVAGSSFSRYFSSTYIDKCLSYDRSLSGYFSSLGYFQAISQHPPLSMTLFLISNIFFEGTFAFRIVSIIFGILSIFMICVLTEFIYNRKAALISAFLAAISFYHILASIQIDQHGAIHFFFFLVAIYGYLRWERGRNIRWFVLGAVAAGLAMLNVYSAIFLFMTLSFYALWRIRDIFRSFIIMSAFSFISFLVYSIFPVFSMLYNRDILFRTFHLGSFFHFFPPVINTRFIVYLLIWLGPLLLGLSIFWFRNKTWREFWPRPRRDVILFLWVLIGAIPLIFTDSKTSIDRYLMLTIPAFIILSSKFLSEIEAKKTHLIFGISAFVLFYAFLMFLNFGNVEYPGHVLNEYISRASSFEWNFFFPVTGLSGPTFGIVFSSIAWSLIVSFILLFNAVVLMLMNNMKYKYALFMFLGVAMAFNIMLAQEMLLSVAHPNYSETNYELIKYYKEHNLPEKVYTNNRALSYYLNKDGANLYSHAEMFPDNPECPEYRNLAENLLAQGNVTVIIFEFPKIPGDNPLWASLQKCSLEKTAYSKGMEYGYIYRC